MATLRRLFSVAKVSKDDGHWTIGYQLASVCGVGITTADPCAPTPAPVGTTSSDSSGSYEVVPFGVVSRVDRPFRCLPEDAALANARLEDASEYIAEFVLWNGLSITGLLALDSDSTAVTAGTDMPATIAALMAAQNKKIPGVQPAILHLGIAAALRLNTGALDLIESAGYSIVTSPAYPASGAAVTGPIEVKLGGIDLTNHYNVQTNRGSAIGTRIAAVDFDPCAAFITP